MLDTYGRKFIAPLIEGTAQKLNRHAIKANQVTIAALLIGLTASIFTLTNLPVTAVMTLWLSGFMDSVDGSMARQSGSTSKWGTLMDITSDRIVELSLIIALALRDQSDLMALLCLTCSIVVSMTIFLTVGALSDKKSKKSFYYQAGLAERTEGFIFFSFMIIFPHHTGLISYLFASAVIFTGAQRFIEAKKILKDS